ncbi:MAG: hypothetical protein Kow0074_23700 [Candidatus Zixiibacteriota bacterium]
MTRIITLALLTGALILGFGDGAGAELLEFDDVADSMLALTHVSSAGATGWDDPSVYTGDIFNLRYHIFVAIKDTLGLRDSLDGYVLDSAALSVVIGSLVGTPGALNVHMIRRDSTGTGIYPAYDDSRSSYCRSEWVGRKIAFPYACPDSILWQTPGATGPSDYDPTPFASRSGLAVGQRYDLDITLWIEGIVNGVDSVSNGIMLLAGNEDGGGTDYIGIRHIHPFYAGAERTILRIWRSEPGGSSSRQAWIDDPALLK